MATGSTRQVAAAVIVACIVLQAAMCMEPGQSGSDSSAEDTFQKGINEMLKVMDRNVHPCDDFYTYACGHWPEQHPILIGESHVDTKSVMDADLSNRLKELLAENIKSEDGEAIAKAKTLYRSCMDESQIDKQGAEPLIKLLNEKFGSWPLLQTSLIPAEASSSGGSSSQGPAQPGTEWIRIMGTLMTYNDEAIIGQSVGVSRITSSGHVIHLHPASLGMSLDKYYAGLSFVTTKEDDFIRASLQYNPILGAYGKYITRTALLLGAKNENLVPDVREIIKFELRLARVLKNVETKGGVFPSLRTLNTLKTNTPAMNWDIFFRYSFPRLTITSSEKIELNGSPMINAILDLVAYSTSEKTVINYLLWRFVMNRMDTLGTRFVESKREFEAEISGSKFEEPRDKVCLELLRSTMGLAVDSLYVKHFFNSEFQTEAKTMLTSIHKHFSNILRHLDWMDRATRELAYSKSNSMLRNIGSPIRISNPNLLARKYQQLKFSPDNFFDNVIKVLKLNAEQAQSKLREPRNRNDWIVPSTSREVSYSVAKNLISLPAGVLQPPLFHPRYPKSLNYGGLGSIIGHEISRGYHSEGLDYDRLSFYRKWWSIETAHRFSRRTQCMIEQYSAYNTKIDREVREVDGTRALSQSVSDDAGVRVAFMAYLRSGQEKTVPGLDLTHHQMFFIKFAQNFCQNLPQQSLPDALKDLPNPFGKFRVKGTLSNLKEFSDAFNCPAGSPMNPEKKCKVW